MIHTRLQGAPTSEQQRLAAESLYRDANSLLYADNKPSEDAIDRVVAKINRECVASPARSQGSQLILTIASTRRASSLGSGTTKTKATSPTSTSATVSSTRRCVECFPSRCIAANMPVQIARYYDKYTSEIRASFERGTAL